MIICGDSANIIPTLADESVDLIVTDCPYGWAFMGKDWDKAVPSVAIWRECLRVLKPGAFAFVMSGPRMDCLSEMGKRLAEAGFETGFTPIFWAYASGFPKAANMGKLVDKRLGAEGQVVEQRRGGSAMNIGGSNPRPWHDRQVERDGVYDVTAPTTPEAQALDGSYAGFQPKPAVEVVIVAMKPLAHGTYIDQALDNRHGVTWLDDARIPIHQTDNIHAKNPHTLAKGSAAYDGACYGEYGSSSYGVPQGRFPANLLVSDDAVDDGRMIQGGFGKRGASTRIYGGGKGFTKATMETVGYGDSGGFSRYFSLDKWWQAKLSELPESVQRTFPFLVVPKAPGSEKWHLCKVCDADPELPGIWSNFFKSLHDPHNTHCHTCGVEFNNKTEKEAHKDHKTETNVLMHPTQKPVKLFAYLITLGSRPGDVVADFFAGVGTMGVGAKMLGRKWLMVDTGEQWCRIGRRRVEATQGETWVQKRLITV